MRRVFFVLDSLDVGGTETQAVELACRLDPARYQVTLACLRASGPLLARLEGSAVSLMEFHPRGGIITPSGLYQIARMARALRKGRFHILHAHDLWANLMGVSAAWLARVPVVISSQRDLSHLDFYRTRRRGVLRRLQKLSAVVLTNAASIRDSLLEEGFSADRIRVIHNGVDTARFRRVPGLRERLFPELRENKVVVLVGNMHTAVKGHPTLIAAAVPVVRRFPAARFLLVGDGAARSSFQALAERSGFADRCHSRRRSSQRRVIRARSAGERAGDPRTVRAGDRQHSHPAGRRDRRAPVRGGIPVAVQGRR